MKKINKKGNVLTYFQGFFVMHKLFDLYFWETRYDSFNDLSSWTQLCANEKPADPAMWGDWLDAISEVFEIPPKYEDNGRRIHEGKSSDVLTSLQAYNAMRGFLRTFATRGEDGEVTNFLKKLETSKTGEITNTLWWHVWSRLVTKVINGKKIEYMRLYPNGLPKYLRKKLGILSVNSIIK